MDKLNKLTTDAFMHLKRNIDDYLNYYKDPKFNFGKLLEENHKSDYVEPTSVSIDGDIKLKPPTDKSKKHFADLQALDFYHSLKGMTPRLATNPEIWAYINHFYLHDYGVMRWPHEKSHTFKSHVDDHWLTAANQTTKLYRSSISGRTWWIAHMSIEAAKASNGAFDAKDALEVFVHDPEYFHISMEYAVLRNPTIMSECILSLRTDSKGINRDGYRELARHLNRMAGATLLDSLGQSDVRNMIKDSSNQLMCKSEFVRGRQYIKNVKPLKVLSLGAGVQSTVLALMAEHGAYELEKPDIAIFADTHWEPPGVYKHLDWLEKQLSYKVIRVSAGNIRENVLKGITPDGNSFLDMPVFLINPNGTKSVAARQCTAHYKINPIHQKLRKILQLEPGKRAPYNKQIEMWMGISADESQRQKPSRSEWITHKFPLIELRMTRTQLYNWFKEHYPERELPRSACVGCPYHTNTEWKWLKENDPKSFNDAVFVDKAIREIPHIRGTLRGEGYLHRDRKSLDSIDFTETESYEDLMINECEGLCGI